MSGANYYIHDISDYDAFFREVLTHFAPLNPTLNIWGDVPKHVLFSLKDYAEPVNFLSRFFFKEKRYFLDDLRSDKISKMLIDNEVVSSLSWGLLNDKVSLALCDRRKNHIYVSANGKESNEELNTFVAALRLKGVIGGYEVVEESSS